MPRFESKRVKVADIVIPADRIRKDLGDINGLAITIHKLGLMNPITLAKGNTLVAGERRLTACRDVLKWKEIDARVGVADDGSELDLFTVTEMEIAENANRKGLTYAEDVENIRKYHKIAVAKMGMAQSGKQGGWTVRDTAAALGKSVGTVSQALQLAAAIEKDPSLADEANQGSAFKKMKRREEEAVSVELVETIQRAGFTPDCIKLGDNLPILKGMSAASIVYINADPPYGIGYDKHKETDATWDGVYEVEDIPHEIFSQLELVLRECHRILVPGGHMHLWYHMVHHNLLCSMARAIGFELNPVPFFWVKPRHGGGISKFSHSNATEPALHLWKPNPRECNFPGRLNYIACDKVPDSQKIHPTEKPCALYRPMIENYSKEGDPILDPYCGSGACLRAGFQLNRAPVGIEMKKEYYDSAVAMLVKEMARLSAQPSSKNEDSKEEEII